MSTWIFVFSSIYTATSKDGSRLSRASLFLGPRSPRTCEALGAEKCGSPKPSLTDCPLVDFNLLFMSLSPSSSGGSSHLPTGTKIHFASDIHDALPHPSSLALSPIYFLFPSLLFQTSDREIQNGASEYRIPHRTVPPMGDLPMGIRPLRPPLSSG